MQMKFETEIPKQTQIMLWKPFPLQSPEMKNPIWPPGGHFKSGILKINRFLPMATMNMHMKFEIEIPKQT